MIYTLRRMQMPTGSQRRRDEKEGESRGGKEDDIDVEEKDIKSQNTRKGEMSINKGQRNGGKNVKEKQKETQT